MTDLKEFQTVTQGGGQQCWRSRLAFTPVQAEKLDTALATKEIKTVTIQRVMKLWGLQVSMNSVSRHRLGDCFCGVATNV